MCFTATPNMTVYPVKIRMLNSKHTVCKVKSLCTHVKSNDEPQTWHGSRIPFPPSQYVICPIGTLV